jgi:hypothetical protein
MGASLFDDLLACFTAIQTGFPIIIWMTSSVFLAPMPRNFAASFSPIDQPVSSRRFRFAGMT